MQKLFIFILICFNCHAQKEPGNIKQAIITLNKTSTDSLKTTVEKLSDEEIKEFNYPYGNYKIIFDWINHKKSKLSKNLEKKGIKKQKEIVMLSAFKNFLKNKNFKIDTFLIPYQLKEKRWEYEDRNKYSIDTIRGFYIPKDLNDCMTSLDKVLPDTTIEKIKEQKKEDFIWDSYEFGLGLWVRNNWGLWSGSRLSEYLYANGLSEPEGMSIFILANYYDHLKKPDYNVSNSIEEVRKKNNARKNRADSIQRIRFSKYKTGDTILYKYRLGFASANEKQQYNDQSCIAAGIIKETDSINYFLKVQLIKCCNKKGIIYIRKNDDSYFNDDSEKIRNIKDKKLGLKFIKLGSERWFKSSEWRTK